MMEQTSNNASAVLNQGGVLGSGTTSITVASEVNVPSTGTFRALIESEIIWVTAVAAHVWTVARGQEGTTAASHADGTTIYIILTAKAMDSIVTVQANGTETSNRRVLNIIGGTVADNSGNSRCDITVPTISSGAESSVPAGNQGDLYLPTDGFAIEEKGASTYARFGPSILLTKPPLVSAFSWVNQGSATATDTAAGLFIQADLVASDNWRMLVLTPPATPYTYTAGFVGAIPGVNDSKIALLVRDSASGKIVSFSYHMSASTNQQLAITTNSSPTVGVANVLLTKWAFIGPIVWLRINDDSTNRKYSISADGTNFVQVFSEARTTFLTANQVGIGLNPGTSFPCFATLVSWKQT